MQITVLSVGKLKSGPERELCTRYHTRAAAMARDLGFRGPDLVELPESRARRPEDRKREEAEALLARSLPVLITLDERAPAMTSEAFAARLASARDAGRAGLSFAIGGADGHDAALMARADWQLSFGALTLPHQLVRALLLEQLYRAMTILAGHPYHRA